MKKIATLLVLALTSAALVACGGGDDNSDSTSPTSEGGNATTAPESGKEAGGGEAAGGSTVKFEADPEGAIAYTTTEASAKAGKVTVDFNNPQGLTHDVAIEDSGGETVGKTSLIASEETSTTVALKPGNYTFYCSVPGHRELGMEGTLTVK